jgi:hypothetical protein
MKLPRQVILIAALTPSVGLFLACTGPDNPKIVDTAPPPKPEKIEPTKRGNRILDFEHKPRYMKAMEKKGHAGQ